jgi:F-type H+-transporting ATPase subunit alpha
LAAFAQFASDLDKTTQDQLARGERLRELLKQPQYSPLAVYEQVAVVYAGLNGYLDDIAVGKITTFAKGLREYLKTSKPRYVEIVRQEKQLNDEAEGILKEAIAEYKQTFLVSV